MTEASASVGLLLATALLDTNTRGSFGEIEKTVTLKTVVHVLRSPNVHLFAYQTIRLCRLEISIMYRNRERIIKLFQY